MSSRSRRDRPRARVDRADPRLPPVEALAPRAGIDEARASGLPARPTRRARRGPRGRTSPRGRAGRGSAPGPPCRSSARRARRRRTARPQGRAGRRRGGGTPPRGRRRSRPRSSSTAASNRSLRDEAVEAAHPARLEALPPEAAQPADELLLRDPPDEQARESHRSSTWKRTSTGSMRQRVVAGEELRDHVRAAAPGAAHEDDGRRLADRTAASSWRARRVGSWRVDPHMRPENAQRLRRSPPAAGTCNGRRTAARSVQRDRRGARRVAASGPSHTWRRDADQALERSSAPRR